MDWPRRRCWMVGNLSSLPGISATARDSFAFRGPSVWGRLYGLAVHSAVQRGAVFHTAASEPPHVAGTRSCGSLERRQRRCAADGSGSHSQTTPTLSRRQVFASGLRCILVSWELAGPHHKRTFCEPNSSISLKPIDLTRPMSRQMLLKNSDYTLGSGVAKEEFQILSTHPCKPLSPLEKFSFVFSQ